MACPRFLPVAQEVGGQQRFGRVLGDELEELVIKRCESFFVIQELKYHDHPYDSLVHL